MILVTGATGTVGRPLVELLRAEGVAVRAVTRNPRAGLPEGVETVVGDPAETFASALEGVTTLFFNPAAFGAAAAEAVARAGDHGVRRVVLLSALAAGNETGRYLTDVAVRNRAIEDALTATGAEWTILRPGAFAANSLAPWSGQIRSGDVVRGAHPGAASAPIHERDIAAVAVRALRTGDLAGGRHELTGPRSLTQEEMVAAIGAVLGRKLRYEEITAERAREVLVGHGLPEEHAGALIALQGASVGRPAYVTEEVERILGRPALTYERWAADHAGAFRAG
ncbi:NAD(P)H-binding protein [Actinomadura sp. DC4]|uniref:NAD(P)H-binding protein n=1 Tax=Actinomadura sp. DC4 TaxID=3055069 RepID=UPI0025B138E4|nr:NAD(P)H-binding protein [Actinomadura sp. DC4]MDN3356186.1 NAD(P)H-binding protein [Actinomadura sp. DC4]